MRNVRRILIEELQDKRLREKYSCLRVDNIKTDLRLEDVK